MSSVSKKENPKKVYLTILAQAQALRDSGKSPPPLKDVSKKETVIEEVATPIQIPYDNNLHTALSMAETFEKSKDKNGSYIITEGFDIHDLINSLVVLCRSLRGKISRGEIETVSQSKLAKK